jgi:hypothetical protein
MPDPAALAQGHRFIRATRGLRMPAWVFGLLALLMLGADALEHATMDVGLGLLLMLGVGWLMASPRPLETGAGSQVDSRVPGELSSSSRPGYRAELHELLALIDGLIDRLECGHDRAFGVEVVDLGIALDALGPSAILYLEERGLDAARLRNGTCTPAELVTELGVERRRALHRELVLK